MKVLLIEPFFTGSHRSWAETYAARSGHEVEMLTLPGRHWKWRMHGGAVTLAQQFLASDSRPDMILATDMLDLSLFLALTRERTAGLRTVLYFHENQLTYPWSPEDEDPARGRDNHYAFVNYSSALAADELWFNSNYHKESFLTALPEFLGQFPDYRNTETVAELRTKSRVMYPVLDLQRFDAHRVAKTEGPPLILWNHRWEYDKAPEAFFGLLYRLADEGLDFRLAVAGESYGRYPAVFDEAHARLSAHIDHWGYAESAAAYARLLWQADILPVTSRQDFFGIAVAEAMYCGCLPLLPDRLAFPEHIPPQWRDTFLYRNETELEIKLREWLSGRLRPDAEMVRQFAARFG